MTRDEWRNYICCVLTVREELIAENPALVQDLVNHVLGAGVWLDAQQANRDKAVAIAAGAPVLQPGPEDPPVRDGESDRSRDLRRPAHDPRRVRGADAAVASRPARSSTRSPTRPTSTRRFARRAQRRAHRALSWQSGPCNARAPAGCRVAPDCGVRRCRRRRHAQGRRLRARPAGAGLHAAGLGWLGAGAERYRGKVVLLGFGFTSCAEVCPITLATLAQARKQLGAQAQRRCRSSTSRSIRIATTRRA